MLSKFNTLFEIIYESYIWLLSYNVKKDSKIWVFGAVRGQKYMDNSKYIFEYIHNNTDIKAVWISKNIDIVNELKSKGFIAFLEHTPEALNYAKKAKIALITHRSNRKTSDLPIYAFSKKTKIIQLWHGMPLKKIAFDDKVFSFRANENSISWKIRTFIKSTFFPFLNYVSEPSLILALSPEMKDIFSQAFRVPQENIVVTGYPRNDILLQNTKIIKKRKEKKAIIYMPTFRGVVDSSFDLFLQYGFDIKKMESFLRYNNMRLDIKLHPFNQPSDKLLKKLELSENIFFLNHDSIYDIINQYDMLITDYSSIYFDYLLLDRPIIFAPFDKDTYLQEDREFYFDYEKITPGPKAMNWDDVMGFLEKFNYNNLLYSRERQVIKNRFHTYQDSKSVERAYRAIMNIINK